MNLLRSTSYSRSARRRPLAAGRARLLRRPGLRRGRGVRLVHVRLERRPAAAAEGAKRTNWICARNSKTSSSAPRTSMPTSAQLGEMERSFGAMLRQLPGKTEVPNLLVDISQTGLAAGLQEKLFQPGSEKSNGFYAELPIKIKLVGTYHDFGKFVSGIAALPRIVTLQRHPDHAGRRQGRLRQFDHGRHRQDLPLHRGSRAARNRLRRRREARREKHIDHAAPSASCLQH